MRWKGRRATAVGVPLPVSLSQAPAAAVGSVPLCLSSRPVCLHLSVCPRVQSVYLAQQSREDPRLRPPGYMGHCLSRVLFQLVLPGMYEQSFIDGAVWQCV